MRTKNGRGYDDGFSVTTKLITATRFGLNVKRANNPASWGQLLLLDWIDIQERIAAAGSLYPV